MQLYNSGDVTVDEIYRKLRRTAASDPRSAREQLLQMLSTDSPYLSQILDLMKPPSEGRLRQLVANTARALRENKQTRDRLIPHLIQWQRFESDEFAKPAINSALQGLDLAAYTDGSRALGFLASTPMGGTLLFSETDIEIYRWIASRLCHRVRNHLELPTAYLSEAIHHAAGIEDSSVRATITQNLIEAQQAFRQVARIVEFNIDDDHFIWHPIGITSWLRRMANIYRSKYGPIRLEISGDVSGPDPVIFATDLLLEVAFWNLWRNTAQETDGECVMTVVVSVRNGQVYLLLIDSGPGLRATQAEEAFHTSISTHGEERGRGLLEVADAIHKLQGTARIIPVEGEYRIEISFPLAKVPQEIA